MDAEVAKIIVALIGSGSIFTIIINNIMKKHDQKLEKNANWNQKIEEEILLASERNQEVLNVLTDMTANGRAHKDENMLLFKGLLGVMDAIQTGKCNGNISHVQTDMKNYLYDHGIK